MEKFILSFSNGSTGMSHHCSILIVGIGLNVKSIQENLNKIVKDSGSCSNQFKLKELYGNYCSFIIMSPAASLVESLFENGFTICPESVRKSLNI